MIPTLPDDFTRADLAQLVNGAVAFAWLFCVLAIALLAIVAFRGRK